MTGDSDHKKGFRLVCPMFYRRHRKDMICLRLLVMDNADARPKGPFGLDKSYTCRKTICSPSASALSFAPSATSPSKIFMASVFSICFWMTRLRGRAP